MHTDRPDEPDLPVPWLASLPLEPGYQDAALVIVHQGRAAAPPEGLAQVLRFHANGHGGWIAAARALAGRWGYIDSEGSWRVPPVLEKAFSFSTDGLARFCQDGRWGYLDLGGRIAIAPTFDNAQPFRHGVCAVQVGQGTWRILDRHGRPQCAEDFRELGAFAANGLARATPQADTGGAPLQGFVDARGHWAIAPRLRSARPFGEWPAAAASLDGVHHGLIDAAGRWVLAPRYAALDEFNADGLAFFAEAGAWDRGFGYLDVHGQVAVQGDRYLSRHMACGVAASSPHGRSFVCADGEPLSAPALSFGTDFSPERGFAVARTAPTPTLSGTEVPSPERPAWGLLHPDGRWVPAPAQLLEPLTDGDGWLVAPQPDTPLVPFITRDGQMAFVNGEGAVVWRAHYDGQQVALLDAQGALLWRSEARANCWPPRPFFHSPITDHLEGLQTLDGVVPLAHRLLAEAQAQGRTAATASTDPADTDIQADQGLHAGAGFDPLSRTARRVAYAGLSPSHSGPYAFLPAHLEGVVNEVHAALAQRLSGRYGAPFTLHADTRPAAPCSGAALRWQVPLEHHPAAGLAGPASGAAPNGLWLTLYRRACASEGEAWWEVWLEASPLHAARQPPGSSAPAAAPPAVPSRAQNEEAGAAVPVARTTAPGPSTPVPRQIGPLGTARAMAPRGPWLALAAGIAAVCMAATPARHRGWVRHGLRSLLRRTSAG